MRCITPVNPKDERMRMKTLFGCIVIVALMAGFSFGSTTVPTKWTSFTSSTGFSVKYPGNWFRKGISRDRLTILSSEGGADATIIKQGQAMISVTEASGYGNLSLSQVISRYTKNTVVLSQREVLSENISGRGCRNLMEIVSKEGAVPPEDVPGPVPYIINTEYFCEINKHAYITVLRNFQGDKTQLSYQKTALQVAVSLRIRE